MAGYPEHMTQSRSISSGERGRVLASLVKPFAVLGALLLLPIAAQANWLSKVVGAAEHAGSRAAKLGTGALENAALHLRSLPPKAEGGAALAAQATQEGHWRFVNRAGETFTAGTPEELKRVAGVLLPETKADAKLSLYLTEDTVFQHRAALKDLPKGTELYVVARNESYRVLRRGEGAAERLFAEVRPSLVVELADRKMFEEAVWQLARPLNKANVRVLSLEPGGPPRLASAPSVDPATKRALVDVIDPASLPAALGSVRGQTVLVTGRVDGRLLYVQPTSGPERSILMPDLFKAAEEADVRSAERQEELDQRVIPGIPSDFQAGYLVLVVLGLFGVPISRAWWRRLWPPEAATEYAGRAGYLAARAVRGGVFLLLFLPLTAPVTAPLNLWRQVWEAVTLPVRLWRRLTGRQAATAS